MTNSLRDTRTAIDLGQYPRMTYIFSPPVTLQSRYKEKACTGFAKETASTFEAIRSHKCAFPYDCGQLEPIVQCVISQQDIDEHFENETIWDKYIATLDSNFSWSHSYFGREMTSYRGSPVFSEFLHTFLPSVVVYRTVEGHPTKLDMQAYINALTRNQTIIVVLYTPKLNTATKLSVTFDFSTPVVRSTYFIEHYRGLTGGVKGTCVGRVSKYSTGGSDDAGHALHTRASTFAPGF